MAYLFPKPASLIPERLTQQKLRLRMKRRADEEKRAAAAQARGAPTLPHAAAPEFDVPRWKDYVQDFETYMGRYYDRYLDKKDARERARRGPEVNYYF